MIRQSLFIGLVLVLGAFGCRYGFWGVDGGTGQDGRTDAGADLDADAGSDPGNLPEHCFPLADPETLALFNFEPGDRLTDSSGLHPDAHSLGPVSYAAGPDGCGEAVYFSPDQVSYLYLDDSPDWDLDTGSIDFWMRVEQLPDPYVVGIVSRDAVATERSGHFSIFLLPDGTLLARIQRPGGDTMLCGSSPVPIGSWFHVAVNLGNPAELYIQGEIGDRQGLVLIPMSPELTMHYNCGSEGGGHDLGDNDNPWLLGADGFSSVEGELEPIHGPFQGGAIDHLRISNQRRDFANP